MQGHRMSLQYKLIVVQLVIIFKTILGDTNSIKMGEANTGACVSSEEGNSSSVSILERALTEVFPEELQEENKSSQVID